MIPETIHPVDPAPQMVLMVPRPMIRHLMILHPMILHLRD